MESLGTGGFAAGISSQLNNAHTNQKQTTKPPSPLRALTLHPLPLVKQIIPLHSQNFPKSQPPLPPLSLPLLSLVFRARRKKDGVIVALKKIACAGIEDANRALQEVHILTHPFDTSVRVLISVRCRVRCFSSCTMTASANTTTSFCRSSPACKSFFL